MKEFADGSVLVCYNKWTGWSSEEVISAFSRLSFVEAARLSEGDRVWIDVENLHPNGKVDARVLTTIQRVEVIGRDEVRVFFRGGYHLVSRSVSTRLFLLRNEEEMIEFTEKNPLATEILDGVSKGVGKAMGLYN